MTIKDQTIQLIDDLKSTCQLYGMGNDGNEFKIITQVFLYKFMADKFSHELKKLNMPALAKLKQSDKWEEEYAKLSEKDRMIIEKVKLPTDVPRFAPDHLIANLYNKQNRSDFDIIFDQTMVDIANRNLDIFFTKTAQETKIPIFERITIFVTDESRRADFARALVSKLTNFSFEEAFAENYDFFSDIFEYLLKDYNTAGGGKYAEYYTPKAIARIMARLLVGDNANLHNVECYENCTTSLIRVVAA